MSLFLGGGSIFWCLHHLLCNIDLLGGMYVLGVNHAALKRLDRGMTGVGSCRHVHNISQTATGTTINGSKSAYLGMQAALVELFAAEGFSCEDVRLQERRIQNRLLALDMDRRWIQAVFAYTGSISGGSRPAMTPANGFSGEAGLLCTALQLGLCRLL